MASLQTDITKLLRYMPSVQQQKNDLRLVEAAWDNLALLSSLSRLTSQTSSGADLARARKDFSALSTEMVQGLVQEAVSNVLYDLNSKAQVGIDILIRNLFERTADIGFLSTDEVLTRYVSGVDDGAGGVPLRSAVEQRLANYVSYYSVYQSVQVFDRNLKPVAQQGNPGLAEQGVMSEADIQFLSEVLHSDGAYTERYGALSFLNSAGKSLVYAKCLKSGSTPVGVLCLQFRMDDELPAIFEVLLNDGRHTAIVLALLDADQRVISSSDPLQLPAGWAVALPDPHTGGIVRHMGREYLACRTLGQPFEGYPGPGWFGWAMVPLDLAFEKTESTTTSSPLMDEVAGHSEFLSGDLRQIPVRSTAIQTALERSVWNGLLDISRVEVAGDMNQSDIQFAKTLLSEIGSTAQKTAAAFASALLDLHREVTHAMVGDAKHRATMAMQILDRNLYERANDCRWWALTPALLRALQDPDRHAAHAGQTLSHINDLYTVYSGVVLYDLHGVVIAVSRPHLEHLLGQTLDEPWIKRSLSLEAHRYAVSDWGASCLHADGNTFVYAAALKDPAYPARPLGGIGLAWNAGSQIGSILKDCAVGSSPKDSFVLSGAGGRPVMAFGHPCQESSVRGALEATRHLPVGETIADVDSSLCGVGASIGVGYREFRAKDGYDHGLQCAVLRHLCTRQPLTRDWRSLKVARAAGRQATQGVVRLASFTAGEQWLSVHGDSVQFAAPDTQILSVSHMKHPMVGMAQINGKVYPVLDLRCAVLGPEHAHTVSRSLDVTRQMVIVRVSLPTGEHTDVAVRVDKITAILEPDGATIQRVMQPTSATAMVDQVVGVEMEGTRGQNSESSEKMMLMVISKAWLQQCAQGTQHVGMAQDFEALQR